MTEAKQTISYRDTIKKTMERMLSSNPHAVLMGEGVTDPTGVFGTTTGFAEKFGQDRVIEMPIAEESIFGMALGAALNGLYPIVTHLRMDFILPGMNQLVNSIAKYKYMYGGRFSVPMLIRAVVGRSWGQGPQHSQSLQSMLAHVPGLTVIMPSHPQDLEKAYLWAMESFTSPVIAVEHRLLYNWDFLPLEQEKENVMGHRIAREGGDVSILAVSYMVQEAMLAAKWAFDHTGIKTEIIDLFNVSDIDAGMIRSCLEKTGSLIVADTGWPQYGVGSEICRIIASGFPQLLKKPVRILGMAECPTPTSHVLEDAFYANMGDIVKAIYELSGVEGELPSPEYIKQQHKSFRGPF